ncbi:MAG: CDP-glucose 4,6-dehydratase [Mariniblastus sp.]|jgi:CDP-glucose 4,6-dehydratase
MIEFWKDRRVLVTGHTGFKGSWLSLWLRMLGAQVHGIALPPDPAPGLLDQFELEPEIDHSILDIRETEQLKKKIKAIKPEIVFHLAAQPLVRLSYQQPVETWSTNVTGSINVLEAIRELEEPVVAIMITTDKVYHNQEWEHGYRETDPLGGCDPYSSSKAAAEIAIASWRHSFFQDSTRCCIASARAGNVIGGGDWSQDRIFPDIIRSIRDGEPVGVRNPIATRPWQHVLEPLGGYLLLAQRLSVMQQSTDREKADQYSSAWNFGPLPESNRSVRELVETALEYWPGTWTDQSDSTAPHEAGYLGLSIDKACRLLDWYPRWDFQKCVHSTVEWYRRTIAGESARTIAEEQIRSYQCDSQN